MDATTPNHPASPDPDAARRALDRANALAGSTTTRGRRWVRTYLLGWAAASVGLVLAIGTGGTAGMIVGLIGWGLLVTAGVTWTRRQGVVPRGAGRRIGIGAGLWAAAYGLVIAVGTSSLSGDLRFWLPAAVFTAVPLVVVALLPARDGGAPRGLDTRASTA